MEIKDFLFLIPARGGSKGVPGKNIKPLGGKPLIYYTLDAICQVAPKTSICVSTDDPEIKKVVEDYGIEVPFLRPDELATDFSSSEEVIIHAVDYYKNIGISFKGVVLLQPTSPFRKGSDISSALDLFTEDIDLVVSVKETSANPYYVLFEEDKNGYLVKSKKGSYSRRQDCPIVYERNGAIFIFNIKSIGKEQSKQLKYVMSEISSIDIDTHLDFHFAEFILKQGSDFQ